MAAQMVGKFKESFLRAADHQAGGRALRTPEHCVFLEPESVEGNAFPKFEQ